MPADKKTYSLDDIKPLSAMSIEPTTDPDYKGFPAASGKSADIFSSLESSFHEIMGASENPDKFLFGENVRQRPLKSAAVRKQNPDAINLPLADVGAEDLLFEPHAQTKTDIVRERHPDATNLTKARIDRYDNLSGPVM